MTRRCGLTFSNKSIYVCQGTVNRKNSEMEFTVDTKAELPSLLKLPLEFGLNILVRIQLAMRTHKILKERVRDRIHKEIYTHLYICT